MEVLNKILPLILTAIMSINLSGCRSLNDTDVTDQTNAAVTELSVSEVSTETTTKSADIHEGYRIATYDEIVEFDIQDHSYDDYKSSLYIDGVLLSIPCKISDLDEHFKFDDGVLGPGLVYDNGKKAQYFADVTIENDRISFVHIYEFAFSDYTISINEIEIDPTKELSEIESLFGKENLRDEYKKKNYITYIFRDGVVQFYKSTPENMGIRIGEMNYYVKE